MPDKIKCIYFECNSLVLWLAYVVVFIIGNGGGIDAAHWLFML